MSPCCLTLSHRHNAARGHKSAETLGRSGKPFRKSKYRVGKHDAFHPFARDEGARKTNQFASWTNIAAGIHSTTASEFRLFPQLTNSWLLTTNLPVRRLVTVFNTARTVQKTRCSREQKRGTRLCCMEFCQSDDPHRYAVKN